MMRFAIATLSALLLAACQDSPPRRVDNVGQTSPAVSDSTGQFHQGLLHGRVTVDGGIVYEGRLRFGIEEEALWINYFNGVKGRNPWVDNVPHDRRPKQRESLELFGTKLASWDRDASLSRPFMARFGDVARIDANGRDLRVSLRSGSVHNLNRYGADDLADGVRVWDRTHGIMDLDEWKIRTIEFLSSPRSGSAPHPLYGTVQTRAGNFTGFIQWNREECLTSDALDGVSDGSSQNLTFAAIRSIARRSGDASVVTLLDGREIARMDTREVPLAHRGIYVDDARYGRVLVSWDSFQQVQFSDGGTGPEYDDFPIGRPLTGGVTTRSDRRINGRLVFDLDESETTETLDAPSQGIDYLIPFRLIASIMLAGPEALSNKRVRVMLRDGNELQLESSGDVGEGNAGVLIFLDGVQRPEYVPWNEVARIEMEGESIRR